MEIIPAILPRDFTEIEEKVGIVKGLVKTVQIDICDGHFVPSTTWPYKKHDENFEAILREERGMPAWEDMNYEFDLMIDLNGGEEGDEDETLKKVMNFVTAGAERIILHVESAKNQETLRKIIGEISGIVEVGLAINVSTPIDVIAPFITPSGGSATSEIKFIQCMGIRKIGYQGQDFDERVLEKVRELKKKWPNMPVSIDGGVSPETMTRLREAGVDRVVTGSAIFESEHGENVNEAILGISRL